MSHPGTYVDESSMPRPGESPDSLALSAYLSGRLEGFRGIPQIRQYTGGYSNLTFLLTWEGGSCILRRPPAGADVKGGHDMSREYRVLQSLKPAFPNVPQALLYCDDPSIIGTPFFLMEKIEGRILRANNPMEPTAGASDMRTLSENAVSLLAKLHGINPEGTGMKNLGRPEGYIQRQTQGWVDRYRRAATDEIFGMEEVISWLLSHQPSDREACIIHNDFKYDNLVLELEGSYKIKAVLDWEMATLGDPLLDLGTTLAYWSEAEDPIVLRPFNLTWLPGNLTRRQAVCVYAENRGMPVPDMLFPYVFGCFKVGVIVQQIYARYRRGLTQDERFAGLKAVLEAMLKQAIRAIEIQQIGS